MGVSIPAARRQSSAWLWSLVAILGLLAAAVPATVGAAPGDAPVTTVSGGEISGRRADGIVQYLGVPFGASTAGENRFAPPRPAPAWTGTRPAVEHGPACPQAPTLPTGAPLWPSSEDCLNIDVYVPDHPADAKLPVMVWLYGGAFVLGANSQYDSPARLVRDGQVIVAIPNYRVGPFGFLALPELADADGGATGTYGTLDQQAALRWIRDNAAAFGGDADNVTLFGESAGGMSVCTQLASPLARGLYAKAIVQSGSCARSPLAPPSKEVAYQRSADYAAALGCADPASRSACLRALPVGRLLDSPTTSLMSMNVTWTPILDGVVLTTDPETALANGAARDIPLITGSNTNEGATFIALLDYTRGAVPTDSDYLAWLRTEFGADTDRVLDRYPLSAFASATEAKRQVITDGFFACPSLFVSRAARHGGGRVWQYQFDDAPLGQNPVLPGAFHAADVLYVFSGGVGLPYPLPPVADQLSRRIQQSWARFAHTGDPETPAFTPWPAEPDRTLELSGDRVLVGDGFEGQHHCDLWSGIGHIG
ncbi:carboxylesterase/lipase family protein [Nocardia sp. NPDC003482]